MLLVAMAPNWPSSTLYAPPHTSTPDFNFGFDTANKQQVGAKKMR
jgi:hypothetical protein